MKKPILIAVIIVVSLSLISFSNQSKALSNNKQSTAPTKDVREVVWNQLPTSDKERINRNLERRKSGGGPLLFFF